MRWKKAVAMVAASLLALGAQCGAEPESETDRDLQPQPTIGTTQRSPS